QYLLCHAKLAYFGKLVWLFGHGLWIRCACGSSRYGGWIYATSRGDKNILAFSAVRKRDHVRLRQGNHLSSSPCCVLPHRSIELGGECSFGASALAYHPTRAHWACDLGTRSSTWSGLYIFYCRHQFFGKQCAPEFPRGLAGDFLYHS